MAQTKKPVKKTIPGIRLVLNGGKPEMDSATIPIQWFFTKAVTARKPTYIVFFVQNERQTKDDTNGTWGRRYMYRVEQSVAFLQLFSSGYHRVAAIALAGPNAKKAAQSLVKRKRYNHYNQSIMIGEIEDATYIKEQQKHFAYYSDAFIAAVTDEFTIPGGLFAPPPPAWKKKWVNRFFEHDAEDECQFRKRAWGFAYHLQIFLFLIWHIIRAIVGMVYCFYVLIASFLSWFFGFQTKNIWWMLKQAWKLESLYDVYKCDSYEDLSVLRCRTYKKKYPKRTDGSYGFGQVDMKFTPIGIVGWIFMGLSIIIIGYALGLIIYRSLDDLSTILRGLGLAVGMIFLMYLVRKIIITIYTTNYMKQRKAQAEEIKMWREKEKMVKQNQKQSQYLNWLQKNMWIKKAPKQVDLGKIPQPLTRKDRLVQSFRLSYWATKIKVCRPFEES